MAVRRRRPLFLPPHPRRNRYIPRMSGASAACTASAVQAGTHSESSDETADVFVPSAGLRLGIFLAEGLDRDGLHLLLVGGLVVEHAARSARDGVDHVHTLGHLAEPAYCLSRCGASMCMMKNWLPAEFGSMARAMDSTPRVCLRSFLKPLLVNSPSML